jgi:lipopolysaccharide cholinephosphotransferase
MIAKDLDALFKKNGIPYFLDGGSALGAVRHKGFIPWDDDFDIIILPEHYDKVIEMCRTQLDTNKYVFEEAIKEYPGNISKIKLMGTRIDELDSVPTCHPGIFVDIFCFDNASNHKIVRFWQLICARIWVSYLLTLKPYTANSLSKRIVLCLAKVLRFKPLRNFVRNQSKTNHKTEFLSMGWCRTRKHWEQYFCPREYFNEAKMLQFEDAEFPVANDIDGYLTTCFGDYMTLPPVEKRVSLHIKSIDFGKY